MTRTTLLAIAMVVSAAGCHMAPCGGCAEWETCDAATQQCVLNVGTRFDLVAVDGKVPGNDWDPLFGPPDPYLCASDGVMEQCSSIQSDDSSPEWNDTLLTGLDGSTLLQTPLSIDYEDSDVDSPDLICSGGVTLTAGELHAGRFRFDCSNGSYARFSLRNTERGAPAL